MSKAGQVAAGTLSEGKRILLYPGERGKGIRRVSGVYWESRSEKVSLGHAGAVDYEWVSGSGDPDGEGNISDGAGTGEGSLEKGKLIRMAVRPRYRLLHGGSGHS